MNTTSWRPTRKWAAGLLGGIGSVAIMYLTSGSWDQEESIAAVGLFVTFGTAYLLPDAEKPGTASPIVEGSEH